MCCKMIQQSHEVAIIQVFILQCFNLNVFSVFTTHGLNLFLPAIV